MQKKSYIFGTFNTSLDNWGHFLGRCVEALRVFTFLNKKKDSMRGELCGEAGESHRDADGGPIVRNWFDMDTQCSTVWSLNPYIRAELHQSDKRWSSALHQIKNAVFYVFLHF